MCTAITHIAGATSGAGTNLSPNPPTSLRHNLRRRHSQQATSVLISVQQPSSPVSIFLPSQVKTFKVRHSLPESLSQGSLFHHFLGSHFAVACALPDICLHKPCYGLRSDQSLILKMADIDMPDAGPAAPSKAPSNAPVTKPATEATSEGKKKFEVKKVRGLLSTKQWKLIDNSGTPWLYGRGTSWWTTVPSAETTSWIFVSLLPISLADLS